MEHLGTISEALSVVTRESLSLTTVQGSLSLCVGGVAVSTITAGNIVSLLAATPVNRATADASGNNIASTYVTAVGVSGNNLTWTKNGVANSLTVPYATNAGSLGGIAALSYKTRIYAEKSLSESGWYRVFSVNGYSCTFLITIYGGYNYQPPTPVTFLVSHSYNTTSISQIGRCPYIGWVKKIRAIAYETYKVYIDLMFDMNRIGSNACNFEITPLDIASRSYITLIDYTKQQETTSYAAICETRTSSSADILETSRTLWGQSFDGSANVSGNMTGVGSIVMTGAITGATTGSFSETVIIGTSSSSASLKIGGATLSWDSANNALKIDRPFYSTIQVAAGGIGQGGSGGGSTSVNVKSYSDITTLSGSESLMDVPSAYAAKQIYDLANSAKSAINGIYNSSTQNLSVGSIVASGGLLTLGHGSITDDQGGMTLSTDEGSINLNSDVYASGNVGIGTAPTSSYKLAVNGTVHATVFDGKLGTATKGAANLPIYLNAGTPTPVTSLAEAYLSWGGKSFSDSYGPIDAAMVPVLGANRSAFAKAAGITVEYSRDGGTTWTDYGAADTTKTALFSGINAGLAIGKANSSNKATASYKLRVTLSTSAAAIYTVLNKFVIYLSTNGSTGCTCTITARLQSNYEAAAETWVTFADKAPVSGWSGFNVINTSGITTYGYTKASQYGQIRFLFECTGGSDTYTGLQLYRIYCFGGVGWTTPSTMAATGNLYAYDASQNATFPAQVTANGGAVIKGGSSVAPLILKGGASSYRQGVRIMPTSGWSCILLAGSDAAEASGTSANSWFIGNNSGNFYITRNGSTTSSSAMLSCVSNAWSLSGNVSIGGTLTANGINIGSGCLAMSKTNGQLDIANDSEWSGVKVWKPVTLGSTINGYDLSTAESPYFKISRTFTGTDGQVHSAYIATNTSRTLGNACEAAKDTAMSQTSSDSYLPTSKAVATYLSNNYIRKTGGTLTGNLAADGGISFDGEVNNIYTDTSEVGHPLYITADSCLNLIASEDVVIDAHDVKIYGEVWLNDRVLSAPREYDLTSVFGQSVGSSVGPIDGKEVFYFLADISAGIAKMYCKRAVTLNGSTYSIKTEVFVADRTRTDMISLYYYKVGNASTGDFERCFITLASNTTSTLKIQEKYNKIM